MAAFALVAGCADEPERNYYDDLTDGGQVGPDASTEGSSADGSSDTAPADDATGDERVDAGQGESGAIDAAPETGPTAEGGCGTPDTVQNCGSCGSSCNTTQSVGAACTGSACTYSGCKPGFGDCDKATDQANLNGCETPTTTTTNCGGCGNACGTLHVQTANTTCTGGACSYMCAAGYSNCNQTAPNTGGCECATPGCCMGTGGSASTCQVTHNNGVGLTALGLGQSFYDCTAVDTYNATQAAAACYARFGTAGKCIAQACPGQPNYYVCDSDSAGKCVSTCWAFGGSLKGLVADCSCPGVSYGPWN
jgi:hypothetical protein